MPTECQQAAGRQEGDNHNRDLYPDLNSGRLRMHNSPRAFEVYGESERGEMDRSMRQCRQTVRRSSGEQRECRVGVQWNLQSLASPGEASPT